MQGAMTTLLLITASVVLTCVVVDYAVNVAETTLGTTNLPQLDRLRNLEHNILNQTDYLLNQTQTIQPETPAPTLAPEP